MWERPGKYIRSADIVWSAGSDPLYGTRWKIQDSRQIIKTDNTKTKHNPGKANNAKHSKTKLA